MALDPIEKNTFRNVRYYASYQLLNVILVVILSSIGAFFHFLLDHEISIVETWLHNNYWEILIAAKLISLFLINRWFVMRLYQLKTIRELIRELVQWPQPKTLVIGVFLIVSYLTLGEAAATGQKSGYLYYQLTSFAGTILFFGIEFIVLAYLDDVLNQEFKPSNLFLSVSYILIFAIAYKVSVPDYYNLFPYVISCFSTLIYLSGKAFKSWSDVVCLLFLFVAPMSALFGMDPVWGDDFSPFRINKKLNLPFLTVIWMISFLYYYFRDQFLSSARRLIR